ncbi:MAG: TatD family hydrolase [Sulfolobaceae archaeon]
MTLIDVHAHIDLKDFDSDRELVISKCDIIIVNAGVDKNSNIKTIELARKYRNIIPAVGFHPEFIEKADNEIDDCIKLVKEARAISEVGLDYYWIKDEKLRKKQKEVLHQFLEVAEKTRKPVILHNRGSIRDLIQILSSYNVKFVIHAYEGSIKDALKIVDMNGYISFPPVLIRDKYRLAVAKEVNIENILTETDSPFLGPEKGKRNEPCNVMLTIKKLAEIKNMDYNEIINIIENNFKKLF